MFTGTITFTASCPANRVSFDRFDVRLPEHGEIQRVELASFQDEPEITATVHFTAVANRDDALRIASTAVETTLDRIAFQYQIVIERAKRREVSLVPVNRQPNTLYADLGEMTLIGDAIVCGTNLGADAIQRLRTQLESPGSSASPFHALFRMALNAISDVEKFLLLYHILLALRPDKDGEDSQANVDVFIRQNEPGVTETPRPDKPKIMETIYTRLRNEIAHRRAGVNLATTRTEISARVGGLITLTKRAIELYS